MLALSFIPHHQRVQTEYCCTSINKSCFSFSPVFDSSFPTNNIKRTTGRANNRHLQVSVYFYSKKKKLNSEKTGNLKPKSSPTPYLHDQLATASAAATANTTYLHRESAGYASMGSRDAHVVSSSSSSGPAPSNGGGSLYQGHLQHVAGAEAEGNGDAGGVASEVGHDAGRRTQRAAAAKCTEHMHMRPLKRPPSIGLASSLTGPTTPIWQRSKR